MEQMYFPGEEDDLAKHGGGEGQGSEEEEEEEEEGDHSEESEEDAEEMKDGATGRVYSFGYGFFGQLGQGNGESGVVPRPIKNLTNIVRVATGEGHSVALTGDGLVYSWGCNRYGQLGLGDLTHRAVPQLMESIKAVPKGFSDISCGTQHTIMLSRSGEVYSTGCGSFGRLGHGDHKHQLLPRIVSALRGKTIVQISSGGWFSACLSNVNALYTWGCNRYGQLGHGKIPVQLFPRHVTSLYGKKVIKVACGKHHTVVYTEKGECFSVGAGMCGQLGNRNKKHSFAPTVVSLPSKHLVDLDCANLTTVILTAEGAIYNWGYVSTDHLGLSETGDEYHSAPVLVDTSKVQGKIQSISAGGWHYGAITENGSAYVWGFKYKGRLGFGELEDDEQHPIAPVLVPALSGKKVAQIACGGAHTLVIVVD